MVYELGRITVKDAVWDRRTSLDGEVVRINRDELLERAWGKDSRILSIGAEIARPGESVRIIPVKDAIQPEVKVEGRGGIFPGLISGVETVGQGRTHVLEGCSILTVGQIVGFQEGMVDMRGPGAGYSAFSRLVNICLVIQAREGISSHEHEEAVRMAGLRAAVYLGEVARTVTPRELARIEMRPTRSPGRFSRHLPRIAYLYMLLSQGLLHDTYLYGRDMKTVLPTLIQATEVSDGAIVSGNCVSACDKNTTYHHQNNPVLKELLARDGNELEFVGTVVTNSNVTLRDKERSAEYAVKLVEMLSVDGVIITKEGFGNPDADAMMLCARLEEEGIATTLITDEFAGVDGKSQSLADTTPQANALVSVGNANELVALPHLDRIIGDERIIEKMAGGQPGSLSERGITAELQVILGATNELGFERLSSREE